MSSDPIAPSDSTLQGQYAGFVSRLIAIVADILLVIVVLIIAGLALQLILNFFRLGTVFSDLTANLEARSEVVQRLLRLLAALGSFYFIFFLYYTALHTAAGGITVGKALMGLRVVRMDGTPLTFGRCTRRYITFLLAALPLFIGLLWVIIDDRRQGWHDKLSGTCVIYDWPAQEDESFLTGLKYRIRYVSETRSRFENGSESDEKERPTEAETGAAETLT